jgi:hypothetical protein
VTVLARSRHGLVGLVVVAALVACGGEPSAGPRDASNPQPPASGDDPDWSITWPAGEPDTRQSEPSDEPSGERRPPARGTVPPPWLGQRVLPETAEGYGVVRPTPPGMRVRRWNTSDSIPPLPGRGFRAVVTDPAPARVIARSTWQPGCPVGHADLAWVRLTYRGFDRARHSGEMLVNGSAAPDLVQVFRRLYRADFPIESMGIARLTDLDAPPTGDGNGTGSFACRPIRGGTEFSQHAYGLAIDVNPFQNPLERRDGLVVPELASAYTDRSWRRPGMIVEGDVVTEAFAAIGWTWGATFSAPKDTMHFSATGT